MSEERKDWAYAAQQWPPLSGLDAVLTPEAAAAAASDLFGGEGSWVTELLQPNERDVLALEVGFIGEDARLRAARFFGHMSPAFHQLAVRDGIGVEIVVQERLLSLSPPSNFQS